MTHPEDFAGLRPGPRQGAAAPWTRDFRKTLQSNVLRRWGCKGVTTLPEGFGEAEPPQQSATNEACMQGLHEIITPQDRREAASLLATAGLSLPGDAGFGLGLYEDGVLQAAGFLAGNLLCGLAVLPARRGEGLAATIAGGLMEHGRASGVTHFVLITKADEADKFAGVGFAEVARSERAAFLEFGRPGYGDWMRAAKARLERGALETRHASRAAGESQSASSPLSMPGTDHVHSEDAPAATGGALAAVVMNANPFTRGHRSLAEAALAGAGRVVVFVVEEEASVFPFAARLELVRKGLADLRAATVLPGGPYMVSRASFPSYFTGERDHAAVHAALDAALFATRIAPDLGISSRYVGAEPLCAVTAAYNEALLAALPRHGIACVEVERLACEGGPVSASRVRALLAAGTPDWRAVAALVPETTLSYLQSPAAAPSLARLATRGGRH